MAINPIDIMRSQEAAQIKHVESNRSQYAQNQADRNFQSVIQHELNKPTQAAKSDNKEYRYDAKEKGNNEYKGTRNKKKNTGKDEKNKLKKQQNSGGIDILI